MTKLICVGACYLDTILSVPHYPEEDSKLRATQLTIRRGGNCPNTLEVLQQLLAQHPDHGLSLHLISTLPSAAAPASARIRDSFGANTTIDLSHCIYREAHTDAASSYVLRSGANGSRTLVNYNDLPEMTADEFKDATRDLDGQTWWHFEGRIPDATLEYIKYVRATLPGARISVEVERPGREGLEQLAAEADVVFYSKSWAEDKGYHSAQECLRVQGSKVARDGAVLFCTWGSAGASSLAVADVTCSSYAALASGQEIRVVDTVGAGDTFIAGMLYSLLCRQEEWDLGRKVKFAVQLATCKVQQEGFGGVGAKMIDFIAPISDMR